jgi:hypothetical protein
MNEIVGANAERPRLESDCRRRGMATSSSRPAADRLSRDVTGLIVIRGSWRRRAGGFAPELMTRASTDPAE